jgi:hypothetical protein
VYDGQYDLRSLIDTEGRSKEALRTELKRLQPPRAQPASFPPAEPLCSGLRYQ